MTKGRFKILIILFIIMLLSLNSICFATNTVMSISNVEEDNQQESENKDIRYSDLYVSNENQYDIKGTIEGNVFTSVDTLNIDSKTNSVITGNLYATAQTVNIKSDVSYSETEKDELGNSKIENLNNISTIYGNAFVVANKFVLEPGCEIDGDLYVCANEIELSQNSIIYGNVFAVGNCISVNSQIGGDLYANVKKFDMKYYGFIYRDLHLNSENANINGYVYRNSFISAKTVTTNDKFINEKDFNVSNATDVTFSGEIKGNANINSKNIEFKNKDNDNKTLTCKITNNLNYSSNKELQIQEGIVQGNTNYSKYVSNSNDLLAKFGEYMLGLLTIIVYVFAIYFIIKKFVPNYMDKVSNLSISNTLIALGLGLGILVLIPIASILLFITRIGSLLGLLFLALYMLCLIIAKPIFIISIATFIKNKVSTDINIYVYLTLVTIALSLINLIPFVGFIVSVLVMLLGLGFLVKSLTVKK